MNASTQHVIIVGGGQSGLGAARAALDAGLRPIVLEAGERPVGSWPHYYDSLTLFSPTQFSSLPGFPFPGDPDAYPTRDAVADYLERYAATLDVEIRTNTRVTAVEPASAGFAVHTATGDTLTAPGLIAASGSFANPYLPELPGQHGFAGSSLHVADYRSPDRLAGQRVVVVGGGNSAVQVAYELAQVAHVTVASRNPLHFWTQQIDGRDLHHQLVGTGFDLLPPHWLAQLFSGTFVLDAGHYQHAFESGVLDRRPVFTAFDGHQVIWSDGTREHVEVVLFATGYRPSLGYLKPLGALDAHGMPLHAGGVSTTHPGLGYVGLEFQRSFSSNTLRGVHRDAAYVMQPLAAHVAGAGAAVSAHDLGARQSAA